MPQRQRLGSLVDTRRGNAAAAWLMVVFVASVVVASVFVGDLLWAGFAAVVAMLAVVPAVAHRDPSVMLPWEVLVLAALPLIGRTFATVPITSRFTTYLAVAAVALIIAVELHAFTPVRMTPSFAVLFVVVGTMAAAGIWAVVRWSLDLYLGTGFLLDPVLSEAEIETALMWEFVFSTASGLVAGVVFEGYFRRMARLEARLPDAAEVSRP